MSIELRNRRDTYEQIMPKAGTRKAMILNVLTSGDPGGMTADEIGERLVREGKIPENIPNFVRPRLTEMKKAGLVEVVARRPSNANRPSSVWRART